MYRMASNVYHVHEGQTACVPAIKSKTNYWGYHVSLNPPKLAFTICPFGYCKSPATNSTEYNACQGKRTGVMCGMCSQSYTEALWSTYCTPVRDCNDHWFWIFFLGQTFSMAIILVFKPPFVTHCIKQIFWFRTLSSPHCRHPDESCHNSLLLQRRNTTREQYIVVFNTTQHNSFEDIVFYFLPNSTIAFII